MISERDLLARFERVERQRDGDWLVRCGAHDDGRPSLHITLAKDRWLLNCLAGCSFDAVCDTHRISRADLFQSNGNGNGSVIEATFDYVDENGRLLYQVVRKPGKRFSQRRPDGNGGWIYKLGDTRRVLYRLPQVLDAVAAGQTIYIVEGEKDVHALEEIGLVATCNAMGAGKWRPEYSEVLRGANVVIVPDCDKPGREHAERAATSLTDVAASVRVLDLEPGRDDGHDLSDYAADARTDVDRAELRRCIEGAVEHLERVGHRANPLSDGPPGPPCENGSTASIEAGPPPGPPAGPRSDRYDGRILDVRAALAEPDVPLPWRCDGFAADGYLTVVAGRGGEGKSWLTLSLACGVARGASIAGIECAQGRALIFDAENGRRLIARRLRAAQVGPDLAVQPVDAGGLHVIRDLGWFREVIEREQANLVVFDSLRVLSSGVKENDSDAMEPIITALKLLARDTGAAIVLVHHRGRSEFSDFRGSSVILDQTDLLFTLGRVSADPDGRHRRKVSTVKCRIDEEPSPRWVSINADRAQGLVTIDAAEPFEDGDQERPRDVLREQVLEVLGGIPRSARSVARAVGRRDDDSTVKRVLADLGEEGLADKRPDGSGWVRRIGGIA